MARMAPFTPITDWSNMFQILCANLYGSDRDMLIIHLAPAIPQLARQHWETYADTRTALDLFREWELDEMWAEIEREQIEADWENAHYYDRDVFSPREHWLPLRADPDYWEDYWSNLHARDFTNTGYRWDSD